MEPDTSTQSIPPTIPQSPIQPPVPEKHKLPILLWLFILALVGVASYFGYQNWQLKQQITQNQPTPTSIITPTATPDPTANWNTFTNTKYGYSFKYPQNYKVDQNGMTSSTPELVASVVAYDSTVNVMETRPRFAVNMMSERPGSLKTQMQEHFNKVSNYTISDQYKQQVLHDQNYTPINNSASEPITQINFNGLTAYEYVIKGNTVNDGAAEYLAKGDIHKYIWVQNGSYILLMHFDVANPADQILSTFKFTSELTSDIDKIKKTVSNFVTGSNPNKVTITAVDPLGNYTDKYIVSYNFIGNPAGNTLLIGKINGDWLIPEGGSSQYCDWIKQSGIDEATKSFLGPTCKF